MPAVDPKTLAPSRRSPSSIPAARTDGTKEHKSAAIVLSPALHVKILDSHIGNPVAGARALAVDITCGNDIASPVKPIDDWQFDLPYPVPAWTYATTAKEKAQMDDCKKAIPDLTTQLENLAKQLQATRAQQQNTTEERDKVRTELFEQWRKENPGKNSAKKMPDSAYRNDPRYRKMSNEIAISQNRITRLDDANRSTFSKRKEFIDLRDNIIKRWANREAYIRYLQSALAVLDNYTGPFDGFADETFTKTLKERFKILTGRNFRIEREKDAAGWAYERIAGRYVTDPDGVLKIPLPPDTHGTVKLEMTHLKLTNPDDAKAMLADAALLPGRAEYDRAKGTAIDEVGSKQAPSAWSLLRGKHKAPFRNFIEITFDTRTWDLLKLWHTLFTQDLSTTFDTRTWDPRKPITKTVFALVWCQPAWTEVAEKDYLDPDVPLHPSVGVKDKHPTLFVSTTPTRPRGRYYGMCGLDGRQYSWPALRLVDLYNGKWWTWEDKWEPEQAFKRIEDARAWLWKKHTGIEYVARRIVRLTAEGRIPHPFLGNQRLQFRFFDSLLHQSAFEDWQMLERSLDLDILGNIDFNDPVSPTRFPSTILLREDASPRYVVVKIKNYIEHMTLDAAETWLVNSGKLHKGHSTTVGKRTIVCSEEDGKISYKVIRYSGSVEEPGESYESLEAAIPDYIRRKHAGIDVAGKVGDPVFAACGGKIYAKTGPIGGKTVELTPWRKTDCSKVKYLHNSKFTFTTPTLAKAGDVVALMGRTGNPDQSSPTHVHVEYYTEKGVLSVKTPRVTSHAFVMPHNGLPPLLPCAAEFGKPKTPCEPCSLTCTTDRKKTCPVHCGKKTGDKKNVLWKECWAYNKDLKINKCPYKPAEVTPPPESPLPRGP